jgi:hypothetical protein
MSCVNPDLLPCKFHMFRPLKKFLSGCVYASDDDVQETVIQWFSLKEFFVDRLYQLVHQWDPFVNACDDMWARFHSCKNHLLVLSSQASVHIYQCSSHWMDGCKV